MQYACSNEYPVSIYANADDDDIEYSRQLSKQPLMRDRTCNPHLAVTSSFQSP